MIKHKYKFECGCIGHGKQRKENRAICCVDHPDSRIVSRIFICDECGGEFERSSRGGNRGKKICPQCKATREESKKRVPRRTNKGMKYKKEDPILGKKQCIRFEDCKHYDQCITPPHGKLLKDAKACFFCPFFEEADPLDPINFIMAKSYIPDSLGGFA